MKETFPQQHDDIDPAMIDKISEDLKKQQEEYKKEEAKADEKMNEVVDGPGEIYDFADTDKSPDFAVEEQDEPDVLPEAEKVEELDESDLVADDFGNKIDDIPESGLMSLEDLEIELEKISDTELLKENHITRETARKEYENMLAKEPIGSPRRETIKQYMREQEKAIDMIAERKEALLRESAALQQAQKPKGFFKRIGSWFSKR